MEITDCQSRSQERRRMRLQARTVDSSISPKDDIIPKRPQREFFKSTTKNAQDKLIRIVFWRNDAAQLLEIISPLMAVDVW